MMGASVQQRAGVMMMYMAREMEKAMGAMERRWSHVCATSSTCSMAGVYGRKAGGIGGGVALGTAAAAVAGTARGVIRGNFNAILRKCECSNMAMSSGNAAYVSVLRNGAASVPNAAAASASASASAAAAAAGEAAEREAALAAVTEKRAQLLEGVAEVPADVQAKTELMAKIDAWLVEVGIGE